MNDKQIIIEIDRFINARLYQYALMINGTWGCGKTFFIEKYLTPHLEEAKKKVLYVSLYGINRSGEIAHSILSDIIRQELIKPKVLKKHQLALSRASIALNFVTKVSLSKFGQDESVFQDIVGVAGELEDYVIIFDDLERCNCNINESLGFINSFVEHSKASVIIVANEDEIGKWQLERNPELQMLVAMNPELYIKEQENEGERIRKEIGPNNNKEQGLSVEAMELRRHAIFHTNDKYKRIKEKVIGETIHYEPDLKEVFCTLIEPIENEVLKKCLKEEIENFVHYARKDKHVNIRTFQFFLEKIQTIFQEIDNQFEVLHSTLVKYCYRSSIRLMKGEPLPDWKDEIGTQYFGSAFSFYGDTLVGFKFIDQFISTNRLDRNATQEVLKCYEEEVKAEGQLENDPIQKLYSWWNSEDEEVQKCLNEIKEKLDKAEYSLFVFPTILEFAVAFQSKGIFVEKCDLIIEALKQSARCMRKYEDVDFSSKHLFLEGDEKERYGEYRKEIERIVRAGVDLSDREEIKRALTSEDWSNYLENHSRNIRNTKRHSFVYLLGADELKHLIIRSNNEQINNLRSALHYLYGNNSSLEGERLDDIDNLQALLAVCDAELKGEIGAIRRHNLQFMKNDLKKYLNLFTTNSESSSNVEACE